MAQNFRNRNDWTSQSCFGYKFFVCEWNEKNSTTLPPPKATLPPTTTTPAMITTPAATSPSAVRTTTAPPVIFDPTTVIPTTEDGVDPTINTGEGSTVITDPPVIATTELASTAVPDLCNFGFEYSPLDNRCYIVSLFKLKYNIQF